MAEKKRKSKGERLLDNRRRHKKRKDDSNNKKKGPRLPSQLRKEIDLLNPNPTNVEDAIDSDESEGLAGRNDLYEYDEPIPQEELKKNRRFDPVDNLEYELPDEFEVWVSSLLPRFLLFLFVCVL